MNNSIAICRLLYLNTAKTFTTTERIRSPFKGLRLAVLAYITRQSEEIKENEYQINHNIGGLP